MDGRNPTGASPSGSRAPPRSVRPRRRPCPRTSDGSAPAEARRSRRLVPARWDAGPELSVLHRDEVGVEEERGTRLQGRCAVGQDDPSLDRDGPWEPDIEPVDTRGGVELQPTIRPWTRVTGGIRTSSRAGRPSISTSCSIHPWSGCSTRRRLRPEKTPGMWNSPAGSVSNEASGCAPERVTCAPVTGAPSASTTRPSTGTLFRDRTNSIPSLPCPAAPRRRTTWCSPSSEILISNHPGSRDSKTNRPSASVIPERVS